MSLVKVPEITVQELNHLKEANADFLLLDVRNSDEYEICNLGGLLIPFNELPLRLSELNPKQHIIIYCHGGGRSSRAADFLLKHGFEKVHSLRGGITAWANEIDPMMKKY